MSPVAARLHPRLVRLTPAPALRLQPACYIPTPSEIRAHGARLILRRAALTFVEIACIGVFVAAVWLWAAIGAGAIHG